MESSKGFFRGSLVHHGILGVVSSHTLTILGGESMAVCVFRRKSRENGDVPWEKKRCTLVG